MKGRIYMFNVFKVEGKKSLGLLLLIIIIIEGLGFISGFLSMTNMSTYKNLIKPTFSPPGWVFPIVWGILYLLMAIAFYRVILKGKSGSNIGKAKKYYFIQLALNLIWSIIFFRFKLYGLAFVDILLMVIFILLTIFQFYKIDKISAYLLVPYVLWVSFAGVLNFYIWMFNEM